MRLPSYVQAILAIPLAPVNEGTVRTGYNNSLRSKTLRSVLEAGVPGLRK